MRIRRSGGSRIGCLSLIGALSAFTYGGQGLYTAIKNRNVTSMTMQEYLQSTPSASWLELRDAVVFMWRAGHLYISDSTARAETIYIPLYAAEPERNDQPTHVVLKTSDAHLVSLYNEIPNGDSALAAWAAKHGDELVQRRTVSGLVQFGMNMEDNDRKAISKLANASDFIVLAEGERPSVFASIGLLGAAIVLLLISLWNYGGGGDKAS